ncbi:MAG TPA: ROK family transcriptional regulator [Candidatus Pullichristensenella stercorigallinarum]|uniref:ROK family transcriptional regulator n=1 Tax=Candidatus Pullichristensenella stercorigallinarum TaxID=2840909 RepID=A0A9D1CW90_9FIRM|nr:ROK family transcriptional regulator [Candidatus Pullichristensenella stercorigallinarum]
MLLDRESTIKLHNHQLTREENCKLIFNLINSESTLTRAELVRITGLSPSTVSSLVDDLVRAELVEEVGLARMATGAGRRPIMLNVNPAGRQIPVFSISRWGVNFKLFDLGYNVLEECFRPCLCNRHSANADCLVIDENDSSGAAYSETIEDIISHSSKFDAKRAVAVLISYPGIYLEEDRTFILTSVQTSFRRETIDALENRLGLPIFMGNSSMSFAYAEKKYRDAHGTNVDDLIYINICDGVGAGIILDGEMLMRSGRIAGEVGHITVEIGGRPCPCGNSGCLERYVNINAIVETVQDAVAQDRSGSHSDLIRVLLERPTLELIGKAYDEGVEPVRNALDEIAEKLFAAIYSMVNVTGIKCVVVGGLERMGEGFLNKLRSFMQGRRGQMWMRDMSIMYPQTGEQADSVGLAQYFIDSAFTITA